MVIEMKKKLGDYEFVYDELSGRNAEINCLLENGSCYTLLFWRKGSEGYSIHFVGDRPLRVENTNQLWYLMAYGQAIMDAEFNLTSNEY